MMFASLRNWILMVTPAEKETGKWSERKKEEKKLCLCLYIKIFDDRLRSTHSSSGYP